MAGWPVKKNAAFNLEFPIYDKTGLLVSAAAGLDSEVSKDGGTFTDCTNEAAEKATSSGMYRLVLTATEMNADEVSVITKTTTTDARTAVNQMYPEVRQIKDLCYPTVTGRSTDVTATGAVGIDWANVENPTTAVDLAATDIQLVDTTTTNTDMVGTNSAALASVCTESRLAELDAGNIPTDIANVQSDTDDIQLRLPAALTTGTADSGTNATMVDAALTQADTDYWAGSWIRFTSGTISGQTRLITGFTPASDTITFAPVTTQAVGTNTYEIIPAGATGVDWGAVIRATTAVDLSATDIQLCDTVTTNTDMRGTDSAALASVATEARLAELDAANLPADVDAILLDTGTSGVPLTAAGVDSVWDEAESGHATAGSFGNNLRVKHLTMTIGAVNDVGATTTDFDTDGFTEATNDHFNEHIMVMTSGANIGDGRRIRDYVGIGQNCIFDRPWTAAPANNDTFIILGVPSDAAEAQYVRLADHEANWDTAIRRVGWGTAKNVNKVDGATTTVAIKKTDDTTNQFTQTATENASANPIEVLDTN